jgi:uncharacterized protein
LDYQFGQFTPEHLEKIEEGIRLFNEQKYWECHEALEELWLEDRTDNARDVYWAIIQVAASCIHYRDKNIAGARGMIAKSREKFRRLHERRTLTPLVFQYLDWQELEGLVAAIPEHEPELADFAALFDFRFKHYPGLKP